MWLIALILVTFINYAAGQINLCNAVCFDTADAVTSAALETSWDTQIELIASDTFVTTCTTVATGGVGGVIAADNYDCFECCVPIDAYTELQRYQLLKDLNDGTSINQFAQSIATDLSYTVTAVSFAYADQVTYNTECTDLSYPQVCLTKLNDLTTPAPGLDQDYYVSIGLDVPTSTVTFRIYYGVDTNFVGLGFGTASMNGPAIIFSTGKTDADTLELQEYILSGFSAASVVKQSQQDLTGYTQTMPGGTIGGFRWEASRLFNTGDGEDYVFSATTESVPIFAAAIGTASTMIDYHGSGNYLRAGQSLQFVPVDQDGVDILWCTGGVSNTDCVRDLTNPTMDPTTAEPSSSPSKQPTTSPIDALPCDNGDELSANIVVDDFDITWTLDCANQRLRVDVVYSTFADNWFGLVLNSIMDGDAILYTSGKSTDSNAGTVGMYSYFISGRSLGNVGYVDTAIWTELTSTTDNGLTISYQTALSNTPYDSATEEITFRYAIGPSGLEFAGKHDLTGGENTVNLLTGVALTTPSPTQGDGDDCGGDPTFVATGSIEDWTVTTTIDCSDSNPGTVTMQFDNDNYLGGWFGVVFNDVMDGQAAIYTTGKEADLTEFFYSYDISAKAEGGVVRDDLITWTEVSNEIDGSKLSVSYRTDIGNTPFDLNSVSQTARIAYFDDLELQYHGNTRTDTLDLLTGVVTKESLTLQITHGIIMWTTWGLLAVIGIGGSAHRFLFAGKEMKGFWFFRIHRPIQIAVVLLDLIGFIIAIVFTNNAGTPHFSNSHMICGLIVTILALGQPLNAFIRPHVPKPGEPKATGRFIWEIVHKGFGYSGFIIALVAIYLGFNTVVIDAPAYGIAHIAWVAVIAIIWLILFFVGKQRAKQTAEISATNETQTP